MNQFVLKKQDILQKTLRAERRKPYGFSGVGFVLPLITPLSPVAGAAAESGFTSGAAAGAAVLSFVSVLAESELLLQAASTMPANKIPKNIKVSFVLFCLIILVVLRRKFTILS